MRTEAPRKQLAANFHAGFEGPLGQWIGLVSVRISSEATPEDAACCPTRANIASFLLPDADERREAAIANPLDQRDRHLARLEREVSIGVECLALFIRVSLNTTPPLPEPAATAARAATTSSPLQDAG